MSELPSRLFWFNPDCELAVADGHMYYTPPQNIARMERDLAYLPVYYAGASDAVLVEDLPLGHFLEEEEDLWLRPLPRLILREETDSTSSCLFTPWGWSPRAVAVAERMGAKSREWKAEYRDLHSRMTGIEVLKKLYEISGIESGNSLKTLWETSIVPIRITSLKEVISMVESGPSVIKLPWSSSGKGVRMIDTWNLKEEEWVSGGIRRQGYVTAEPFLDRVEDFAMEFYMERGRAVFRGLSYFRTGNSGEYGWNFLGPQQRIYDKLSACISREDLMDLSRRLEYVLTGIYGSAYEGYMGVDMMIYRDGKGGFRLHPCVEVNLRYTMGVLALYLSERNLEDGSGGKFFIRFFKNSSLLSAFDSSMKERYPLHMCGGRIKDGYKALNPIDGATCFLAYIVVKPACLFNALF